MSVMSGCVAYTRRFFEEIFVDPAHASPLLFPETVFNAPASHLASLLKSTSYNYTLVGDDATFINGLALGAGWLLSRQVDACLVIGAEEMDWLTGDAVNLFAPEAVKAAGAGAVYLKAVGGPHAKAQLQCVTDPASFRSASGRREAARLIRSQLPLSSKSDFLCLSTQGVPRLDSDELSAWSDWDGERCTPKELLGEAFTAAAAWLCVAACDALAHGGFEAASVSVVGANQTALGCRFISSSRDS
ncbi:MAG: hypothetical protein AB9869_11625 [Verrucomicrobiia bacterium]